jgi:cobalt-zinc-cadmium resistance protein CzcA
LIFLLQWVFLGNLRSAVIVGATIPFALFFAIGIMVLREESANLLSVGAIDFGLIVDATVLMVESIFRRLAMRASLTTHPHRPAERQAGRNFQEGTVVKPLIFCAPGIIIAGFIPLSRWWRGRAISSGPWQRLMPMPLRADCWQPSPSRRR